MGINFDGVNPEMKAKLEKIVEDGKVSQAEYNSLTAAEKEALETGLAGKIGDDTLDRFKFSKGETKKPEAKDDDSPWYKKAWEAAKAPLAGVALGASVGAGVGACVGGIGAVPGAVIGGVAGLFMMGMTSCSGPLGDEPDIKIEDNSNITVNVQLSVKIEDTMHDSNVQNHQEIVALLNSILTAINNGNKVNQENQALLNKILTALTTANLNDEDIKALLQKVLDTMNQAIADGKEISNKQTKIMNAILDAITKLDSNLSAKLMAIIDKIDAMGDNNYNMLVDILNAIKTGNGDNSKLLEAILNQVIEGNEQNKDMDAKTHQLLADILNSIGNFENSMKDALAAVIAKIGDVSVMTSENKALLEAILNKMGDMDAANQQNFAAILNAIAEGNKINAEGVKVLTAILNKLDKMDASTQGYFKTVIDMLVKGNDINAEILNKLTQVLAKLDKMDASQANFFTQILAKFDKLDAGQQANLEKILDAINNNTAAINKNTVVAEATYELVAKLLDKVDGLNVNVSEILDAIANISVGGGNVDLSTVEKLLADLLKSSEMNNKVLTNIEAKLDAVAVTIGGIKVALGEGHEKILAKLDEILKKIPNGCHCDIDAILVKLDILIESIQKNPNDDNKHEGILDDLEDLFN